MTFIDLTCTINRHHLASTVVRSQLLPTVKVSTASEHSAVYGCCVWILYKRTSVHCTVTCIFEWFNTVYWYNTRLVTVSLNSTLNIWGTKYNVDTLGTFPRVQGSVRGTRIPAHKYRIQERLLSPQDEPPRNAGHIWKYTPKGHPLLCGVNPTAILDPEHCLPLQELGLDLREESAAAAASGSPHLMYL